MKRTQELVLTMAGLVGMATSGVAAMTIWLLLTQPLTVANAVNARDLTPLAQAIAGALLAALTAVVRYL
jgi:hypothetical protein